VGYTSHNRFLGIGGILGIHTQVLNDLKMDHKMIWQGLFATLGAIISLSLLLGFYLQVAANAQTHKNGFTTTLILYPLAGQFLFGGHARDDAPHHGSIDAGQCTQHCGPC